jgi:hypothetical protein
MPIIAITCLTKKGVIALTCLCSQREYENYTNGIDVNEYMFPAHFVYGYLERNNAFLEDDVEIKEKIETTYKKATIKTVNATFKWLSTNVISIDNMKDILSELKLDYVDFVNAYCEHLKTV